MGALDRLTAAPAAPRRARLAPPPPVDETPEKLTVSEKISRICEKKLGDRAPHVVADLRRIIGLRIVHPVTEEEADAYSAQEVLAAAYNDPVLPFRLKTHQVGSILAWDHDSGPLVGVFVGGGKSLISYMIAERAFRSGIDRSVLFVPSGVYKQAMDPKNGSIRWARSKVPLTVPFHFMRKNAKQRAEMAKSAKNYRGCYVLPYSLLSTKDTRELLDQIEPGLIIADEAHRLRNRDAARTKRVMEYIDEHSPRLVLLSGTITKKGVKDYWHLIRAALRENCPLPLSAQLAEDWGDVLDSKNSAPSDAAKAELRGLVEWARKNFPQESFDFDLTGFRTAYQKRFCTAPGVVTTGSVDFGCSLHIVNTPAVYSKDDEGYKLMNDLMRKVVDEWVTPNGDEIDCALEKYKWQYELSAGFYNERFWPEPGPKASADVIERSKLYHKALNKYHRALRKWLMAHASDGLDTPMLVANNMSKHGSRDVGDDEFECGSTDDYDVDTLYGFWTKKNEADFEGRIERDKRVVRVYDYKVKHAVKWAKKLAEKKQAGGIVWFFHYGVGNWLLEEFQKAGLDPVWGPAGADARVLDKDNKGRWLILSIQAHGEGKELQHHQNQLFVQFPRSATLAEQSIGREHRLGQEADELVVDRCDTLPFDIQNFGAALNDSVYVHQTTGNEQKLVYATYEPIPTVYSPEWLRENGFRAKKLNQAQRQLLAERFGQQV